MREASLSIFKQRGILGFYSGLSVTLVEILPYAGLQFGAYDLAKKKLLVRSFYYIKALTLPFPLKSFFFLTFTLCGF